MGAPGTYTVDTKGGCFMCLKLTESTSPTFSRAGPGHNNPAFVSPIYSLGRLSHYLRLDFQRIFNIASNVVPPMSSQALDQAEVMVPLCRNCASEADHFAWLHLELDRIQQGLAGSVRTITGIMEGADMDVGRRMEYEQRMASVDPMEIIQTGIAENLRRQLIEKGKGTGGLNVGAPKTRRKVPPLTMLETMSMSITPVRMPLRRGGPSRPSFIHPRSAQVARRTPGPARRNFPALLPPPPPSSTSTSRSTPSKKPRGSDAGEVELVDLEDDDSDTEPKTIAEEEKEDEEDSGLVIRSISGANGLTVTATSTASTSTSDKPPPAESIIVASPVVTSTNSEEGDKDKGMQSILSEADSFLDSLFAMGGGIGGGRGKPNSSTFGREVGSKDIYKLFDNGRVQCRMCGKNLSNHSPTMEAHKMIHLNKKPYKCIHCPARFRNVSNLKIHITGYHRVEMLSFARRPEVHPEVFRNLVQKFFRGIGKSASPTGADQWLCKYCQGPYKGKVNLEGHLIQVHSDDLRKDLDQLQENLAKEEIPDPLGENNPNLSSGSSQAPATTTPTPRQEGNELQTQMPGPIQGGPPTISSGNGIKFKCRVCSRSFHDKNVLRRHFIRFHTKNNVAMHIPPTGVQTGGAAPQPPAIGSPACPYCSRRFKFNHSVRFHILNYHRFQAFRKHLPQGMSEPAFNAVIRPILSECTDLQDGTFGCEYCPRRFSKQEVDQSQVVNHALIGHFDAVLAKLKAKIGSGRRGQEVSVLPDDDRDGVGVTNSTSTLSSTMSAALPSKVEEDDDIIEILPD